MMTIRCAAVLVLILTGAPVAGEGEERAWPLRDGANVTGQFVSLVDSVVTIQTAEGPVSVPFAELSDSDRKYVLDTDDTPLPSRSPGWVAGYRVRYVLRAMGDLGKEKPATLIARLPTGGWLKPDASDLLVQSASGRVLPAAVLSHDPLGHTIIQFKRDHHVRWYWVYAMNPKPEPVVDPELARQIVQARADAMQALKEKAVLQKASADRAEELRRLTGALDRHKKTAADAANEIARWDELLPERQAALDAAREKVGPAEAALASAERTYQQARAEAERAVARAQKPVAEAVRARKVAEEYLAAWQAASKELEETRKAHEAARTALEAARQALETEKARTPIEPEKVRAAEGAVRAASEALRAAERLIGDKERALGAAQTAKERTKAEAEQKAELARAAEEEPLPARLAERKALTEKEQAEGALRDARAAVQAAEQAVRQGRDARDRAANLKAEADAAIEELMPSLEPLTLAAQEARAASAEAVERAERTTERQWELAAGADPTLYREGMTFEVRRWEGDELANWPVVWEGLHRSDTVLGNGIVPEVLQNCNPARPGDPLNFAASYRGFLKIDQPGIYRFFVNGDDAAFLFINNYKVYSRISTNVPRRGSIPLYAVGTDIELDSGVHPFEIHHIVGNTPGATGYCTFMWLTPDSKQWTFVPPAAFSQSMLAVPVAIEEAQGRQAAAFSFGVDDVLSSDGVTLYLVRFEATGTITAPSDLRWTFGDGTTASGRTVTHVYFREGDYEVSLRSARDLPVFRRRVHVWTPPAPTNPLSLAKAVERLNALNLRALDRPTLNSMFEFLLICEQPTRWPLLERLCRHLLAQRDLDVQYRTHLYTALMDALAQQGQAAEAVRLVENALDELPPSRALRVSILLKAASIYGEHLKDYTAAGQLYERILSENRRFQHPLLRRAAISWGDLYLDGDDLARAGEAYRLAATMGRGGFAGEGATDSVTRGALLRAAEQQLKGGDIRQMRRLLARIESEFPEQKLEGLYRYLRGEADRTSGRYEQAVRHYEVLLKLRQWAGYRAPALYGIADSYYRMGRYDDSLRWLAALKESFPTFYEQRKLETYEAMIRGRIERLEEAGPKSAIQPFAGFHMAFEPADAPQVTPNVRFRFLPTLGFDGPSTLVIDYPTDSHSQIYAAEFKNVESEGAFWLEFWYRNTNTPATSVTNTHVHTDFHGDGNVHSSRTTLLPERTYGEWRKVAGRLRAPVTKDGTVSLLFVFLNGLYEIDGLRVMPIADWQEEALRTFIEGAHPQ